MIVRDLVGVDWPTLAAAFTEAFSDYAVPMVMTPAALEAMQRRRGYDASVSFGAFEGDELVAFALTCSSSATTSWIYNSGTGVVPRFRRHGLAKQLVERVIAEHRGACVVLEVLETNAKAIALYDSLGFRESRRLQCWTYDGPRTPLREQHGQSSLGIVINAPSPATDPVRSMVDTSLGDMLEFMCEPAWQNSFESVRRAVEPFEIIGGKTGSVVVFPSNGDVPLLFVEPRARRQGLGTQLLAAAAARVEKPLRILNVDTGATDVTAFLEAAGCIRTVRQLEMICGVSAR